MLTIKSVNRAIAAQGHKEILCRGKDYFYFYDGEADNWFETIVPVCAINHLSLQQWLDSLEALRETNNAKIRF